MSRGKAKIFACLVSLAALSALPASASAADSMALQPDGKIVLAGGAFHRHAHGGALVRLNPNGGLDESFGAGGVSVDFRRPLAFGAVAVQPNGQILAGRGRLDSYAIRNGFGLAAFGPDGAPNSEFGAAGAAAGTLTLPNAPVSIQVLADGRVLVGGTGVLRTAKIPLQSRAVAQVFESNGSFREVAGSIGDAAFGEPDWDPEMTDFLLRPDGSLIVAGRTQGWGLYPVRGFLARFEPGSKALFDRSFGGDPGFARVDPFSHPGNRMPTYANAVVASGGRLVVAGAALEKPMLMGFKEDGSLDPTFGEKGVAVLPTDSAKAAEMSAAVVQPDGKIVIAGKSLDPCQPEGTPDCWSLLVGRVNPDGSLDAGFGTGGFTRIPHPVGRDVVPSLVSTAVASDGGILIAETTGASPARQISVAKLRRDGSLDPAFGQGGIATIAPCQGELAELRASGCFSSAMVRLRTRALRVGRPRLDLRVEATQELDPLARVRIVLPRGIRARPASVQRSVKLFSSQPGPVRVNAEPRRITLWQMGTPPDIRLNLPRGSFERTGRITPDRKLTFRVRAEFHDGSAQTIVLRR